MNFVKKFWPPFFLLAAIIFFFRELLFLGKTFVPFGLGLGDHNLSTVPLLHYLFTLLKEGSFPLWDPYTLGGLPLTSGVIGVYHPFNFLLFRFLPFPWALNLYLLSIFLILGFGTFYFIKSLRLSNEAALLASLSFTFASGVISRVIHTQIIATIAYLPLLLLLTQKFFQSKNPLLLILTGLTLALQIFYGHQPTVFISLIGFFGFFLFKIVTEVKPRQVFSGLLALFAVSLIGVSLAAVHLIPGWQVFSLSGRNAGITPSESKEYPFHPGELAYFLQPTPIGTPSLGNYDSPYPDPGIFWENTAYIGLLGLTLAALAILFLARSRKEIPFFGLLLVVAVILALGKFTPFFFLLRIPPFSFFRLYSRFLLLAMFSLAVLAAFGFDGLTQKYRHLRGFLGLAAALFILVNLFPFALSYNATYETEKWLSPPTTVQFLKEDPSFFRVYSLGGYEAYYQVYRQFRGWQKTVEPYFNLREGLALNLNLFYRLHLAGAGAGINKTAIWQGVLYQNLNLDTESKIAQPNPLALKMLRLLGVKYLVSYFELRGEDLILRKTVNFSTGQPGFSFYELRNPLPHAFIVHQAKTITNSEDILKEFAREEFNPQKIVLLEEAIEKLTVGESLLSEIEKAEVIQYLPQKVVISTQVAAPGFLVLTDTHFPGWEAKIDGKPAKIYQANSVFRAVKVEPGKHQVEFEYKPRSFYLGAAVSSATFLLMIIFSLYWLVRTRKKLV